MDTNRFIALKVSLVVAACFMTTGCSMLGFSPYPVAHALTDTTKEVLGNSPRMPMVPRELSKKVQEHHFLQPGDEVLIEVNNFDSEVRLPADQRVLTDGTVDLGRYGRVRVAGMTLEQAESLIQSTVAASEDEDASINVRLVQPIHRYYVVGEVNSPGAYALSGHETVLDAILEAGGLTNRASACDLLLARPTEPCECRVTLPVCYRAITQLGDTTTNYHLQPGDRIFVGRQSTCEEFCAFIKPGKTCERCWGDQKSCCDPNVVEHSASHFMPWGNRIIPAGAVTTEADMSGMNGTQMTLSESIEPGVWMTPESDPASPPATVDAPKPADAPMDPASEPIDGEQIDGELSFESFLKNATE